jgi:hypothetical protein
MVNGAAKAWENFFRRRAAKSYEGHFRRWKTSHVEFMRFLRLLAAQLLKETTPAILSSSAPLFLLKRTFLLPTPTTAC